MTRLSHKTQTWSVWFITLALLLGFGLAVYRHVMKALYPIHFGKDILMSSQNSGLDPFLLASIIRVESNFNPTAISRQNARGLMQIMPKTGRWIADQTDIRDYSDDLLFIPSLNISMGSWYISSLLKEFGSLLPALAAYNAGRGNVRAWLKQGQWDGSAKELDSLPFLETRVYVRRINNALNWYRRVYRGSWPTTNQ